MYPHIKISSSATGSNTLDCEVDFLGDRRLNYLIVIYCLLVYIECIRNCIWIFFFSFICICIETWIKDFLFAIVLTIEYCCRLDPPFYFSGCCLDNGSLYWFICVFIYCSLQCTWWYSEPPSTNLVENLSHQESKFTVSVFNF